MLAENDFRRPKTAGSAESDGCYQDHGDQMRHGRPDEEISQADVSSFAAQLTSLTPHFVSGSLPYRAGVGDAVGQGGREINYNEKGKSEHGVLTRKWVLLAGARYATLAYTKEPNGENQ